jgi:tetratricopeptide (TPR) repeat protein
MQAGDRAARVPAMVDAARNYRAALEGWPETDRAGRAATVHKLANCVWITGDQPATIEALQEARDLFDSLGDRRRLGDTERMIGRLHWEMSDRGGALEHYHNALRILEVEPESVELARAISSISQMHMLASEYDEAITWGERALTLGQRLEAEDVIVHALNNVGSAYLQTGQADRGLPMLRESLERATEVGLPHDVCRAGLNMGEGLIAAGRFAEAKAVLQDALVYAQRHFVPGFASVANVRLTMLEWVSGEWASALARRAQIPSWHAPVGGIADVWARTLFGHIDNDLGRPAGALAHLEPNMTMALESDEVQTTVPFLGELLRTHAASGEDELAAEAARLMLDRIDRSPYLEHESILTLLNACYWAAARPTSEYMDLARTFSAEIERAHRQYRNAESEASLAESQAILWAHEGKWEHALQGLGRATATWQRTQRPYDQARSLIAAGGVLMRLGQSERARESAEGGLSILVKLTEQLTSGEYRESLLASRLVREARLLASPD